MYSSSLSSSRQKSSNNWYHYHLLLFILIIITTSLLVCQLVNSFTIQSQSLYHHRYQKQEDKTRIKNNPIILYSSNNNINNNDYDSGATNANKWQSSNISNNDDERDWEDIVNERQDGSFWSSFSLDDEDNNDNSIDDHDDDNNISSSSSMNTIDDDDGGEEAWLDTIAQISADEITFMNVENDRADKVRQMQEMEFSPEAIAATLGVEVDDSKEIDPENQIFEEFKKETKKTGFGMYLDVDYDMTTVESHTTVEMDDESNEPIRTQMVYVDEHTCIGCTHCAMVAQSTFFMEEEHGRARVFQQWGDDDETIQIAIETCPVDCIHYVPYDELKRLEIERRGQNINFKARLVSQAEYGGLGTNFRNGSGYTAPQQISGNLKPRCNNCPSKGCANCPSE